MHVSTIGMATSTHRNSQVGKEAEIESRESTITSSIHVTRSNKFKLRVNDWAQPYSNVTILANDINNRRLAAYTKVTTDRKLSRLH